MLSLILIVVGVLGIYVSAFLPRSSDPAKRHLEWMVFWIGLNWDSKAEKHLNAYVRMRLEKDLNDNRT